MVQICAALEEAHGHQIAHRDLKPDNIIIAQTTRGLSVKTLDFGVARWRDLTSVAGALTATGAVIGTPMYMSPEQCLGQEVDGRADIYSLGVMLYEMLSGALPFSPPTPAAFIAQHVHQAPQPLRSINSQPPAAVESAVMRALEKRPEAKPQTTGEFARQLKIDDGFCSGEMILNRNELRFQSNDASSRSFNITPRGVIELRNEAHKSGRLLTRLALPQGGMEVKQTYNFYPTVATLRQNRLRVSVPCDIPACQAMGDALYQTLRQFQQ